MQQPARPVKKSAVSGSIGQRWPKPRVVRWLEIGAIPAIAGLWLPDWLGGYVAGQAPVLPPYVPAFPPVLAYVGAAILFVACYQGIKGMGSHFLGVRVAGALMAVAAIASIVLQLAGFAVASLLATGVAALSAAGFFWFTIGKVAEITQETRARRTWVAVAILTLVTAVVYLTGVGLFAAGSPAGGWVLRAGVASLTVTFALCRYGVHCYKTQRSIGAVSRARPDEQYWAAAS